MTHERSGEAVGRALGRLHPGLMLLVVLALGLGVRLVLIAMTEAGIRNGDEGHYFQLAANLYNGFGFGWAPGKLTSIRPPLYPWFLSVLWTVSGGTGLLVVRVAQAVLSVLTALLIYVLGTRMFDRRVGLLAAAVLCFYPSLLFASLTILTETLFTFLLVLFAVVCERCIATRSMRWAGAAGAVLALAALTRSVLWPFPVVAAPLLVLLVQAPHLRRAGVAVVFLAGYAIVIAPWAIRNTRLQHVPTVVDTMGGFNLWMGNYERTPDDRIWAAVEQNGIRDFSAALEQAFHTQPLTEGDKDRWGRQEAFRYMRAHPLTTAKRSVLKFADFWGLDRELVAALAAGFYHPPAWARYPVMLASTIAYPLVMVFACLGLFMVRPRSMPAHVLVIALVLFVCALHTVVFGHSRYRLPLMPFFFVYAGAAVAGRSWEQFRAWRLAPLLPVATICALAAVWGRELLVRDWDRIRGLFGA